MQRARHWSDIFGGNLLEKTPTPISITPAMTAFGMIDMKFKESTAKEWISDQYYLDVFKTRMNRLFLARYTPSSSHHLKSDEIAVK